MNLELVKPIFRPNVGHVAMTAAVGLVLIGLAAIDTTMGGAVGSAEVRQGIHLLIGIVFCLVVAAPHHRLIGEASYPLAILAAILLMVVLLPLPNAIVPMRNGAKRWIDLGLTQFQPSELAKIAYVLALARYLRYRKNYRTLTGLAIPFVLTFVPMALIVVEPDLGTALVFLPVLFAMLLAAGAKLRHLFLVIGGGLAVVAAVLVVELTVVGENEALLLKPHQKERIVAMASMMTGDRQHDQTINYQAQRARMMAGVGGAMGQGKERAAVLLRHNPLPEAHNDMIFAVICARWGLAGGLAVMLLYLMLLGACLLAAAGNKDPFARLIAVGVASSIFSQVAVNIGMTVGIMPITGITLPFVSYGGTSLLANFGMVGLVLNVASRRPIIMANPTFEYDTAGQWA